MARLHLEEFMGKEVARIYTAGRLGEAMRVETSLTEHGIDYAVDFEPFRVFVLGFLPSERVGLGFYVLSAQADHCRRLLLDAGLRAGIEADPE
jgi:hypothetical protein